MGAALYIQNVDYMNISDTNFTNNSAYYNSTGDYGVLSS